MKSKFWNEIVYYTWFAIILTAAMHGVFSNNILIGLAGVSNAIVLSLLFTPKGN